LIFTRQNGEDGIAVQVADENVWLRAEVIAELFQKSRTVIVEHLFYNKIACRYTFFEFRLPSGFGSIL